MWLRNAYLKAENYDTSFQLIFSPPSSFLFKSPEATLCKEFMHIIINPQCDINQNEMLLFTQPRCVSLLHHISTKKAYEKDLIMGINEIITV